MDSGHEAPPENVINDYGWIDLFIYTYILNFECFRLYCSSHRSRLPNGCPNMWIHVSYQKSEIRNFIRPMCSSSSNSRSMYYVVLPLLYLNWFWITRTSSHSESGSAMQSHQRIDFWFTKCNKKNASFKTCEGFSFIFSKHNLSLNTTPHLFSFFSYFHIIDLA